MFYENSFLKISQKSPVDTGRKLNVHKTFRRRARRLLNVLCTFNLRPVSTGHRRVTKKIKKRQVFSYDFYTIFQNTFLTTHFHETTSDSQNRTIS